MSIARHSIATRILLPIFVLVAGLTLTLLLLLQRITSQVGEDYHRFTVTASASQITTILELAAAELTAAKLTDNPIVAEAKMGSVREAIALFWSRSGLGGVVATEGGVAVFTTLDPAATRDVLAHRGAGYFSLASGRRELHCFAQAFPPWGWTITTTAAHTNANVVRPELVLLLPLLTLGATVMCAGVFLVLWRNLRRPVAEMVAAVEAEQAVAPTGLEEFDSIGRAVNEALARVRERTAELTRELGERRRVEAALHEREGHIRLLLNSTAEGIYGVDVEGTCTFCNPSCLQMLGYEREEELLGKDIHALVHHTRTDGSPYPAQQCRIYLAYREARATHVDDEVFWRKDGKSFRVEYWSHPVVDNGVVAGAVVAFFDISEKSVLEQQLRQSQKMEAVGRLAGGIAHDFNNMLMAIVGYASLAHELTEEGSKLRAYNEQVLAAADKATDLTRQILAFSRKQVMSTAPVDLNGIILGLGKIIARLLGEDIEIGMSIAGTALVVLADRAQLEQVLMNLCTNARDAMPGGGRLAISTQEVQVDQESAEVHDLETTGRYALITVSDTGSGMDARTRERIFEPFFTTKELGKGTGLGLSIVYGIVKQHHGQISVYSEPGRGTTFRIYLPLTGDAVVEQPVAATTAVRGGTETVLLAEDNADVRTLARSVLASAGYRVLEARDGREAVRLFGEHRDEIGLCLFDVVMPHLSGKDAFDAIRELAPGVRGIFMSGYAADILADPQGTGPSVVLLSKPLLPRDLLRHVREALDA
jgi:PAS domain S-box-containing protein